MRAEIELLGVPEIARIERGMEIVNAPITASNIQIENVGFRKTTDFGKLYFESGKIEQNIVRLLRGGFHREH